MQRHGIKKIHKLGLQPTYNDKDSSSARWLKYLFALPGVDADLVFECFEEFAKSAPNLEGIKNLISYMSKTYFAPSARYQPAMWANLISNADTRTTTNGCESFHRHFGDNFRAAHPNIYIFMENLQEIM